MKSKAYPSDLTDEQWALMEPFVPEPKAEGRTGRPREYSYRQIVNGIIYVLRTGCTWEMMPHDLPPHATCYHYFRIWQVDGTWQKCHDTLREQVRTKLDREPTPSAAVLDSQSDPEGTPTTEKGGRQAKRLLATMQASVLKDVSDIFS